MINVPSHHPVTIDRIPMSSAMKLTLKTYIAKQKQKKKEEEEQDAVLHRERKIREIKRQQDTATLEQTNEQLDQLETKLEELKKEKHDLFARLKKVLNFEEEQRRKVQQLQFQHAREASEVLAKVGPVPPRLIMSSSSAQPVLAPATVKASSTPVSAVASPNLVPPPPPPPPPIKRPRSPSPHTPTAQPPPVAVPVTSSAPLPTNRHILPPPPPAPSFLPPRQQLPVLPPRLPIPQPQRPAVSVAASTTATAQQPTRLIDFRPFSPPHHFESRCIAPQATHLPPRIPQHVPPMIPILSPNSRQIGGVASGFPLHRPPLHAAHHAIRMHHISRQTMFQRKPSAYPYYQRM